MRMLPSWLGLLTAAGMAVANPSWADEVAYDAPHQVKAFEIYRTGIAFRTAEGHGQVPAYADYLGQELIAGGFPEEDIRVIRQTLSTGEETALLIARYRGDGSAGKAPILLTAHMDVVDALPEDWERDPFTLIEDNGFFFGRGTFDDKLGVTALLATFLRLKGEGFVPSRDLILGFTGDEETGGETTTALVTTHRDLIDAEFALNADAGGGTVTEEGVDTSFLIQTAEKTYATFTLTLRNPGGHSSMPRPDNAIYELATALQNIAAYRFPLRMNDTTRAYFKAQAALPNQPLADVMQAFLADPENEEVADRLFGEPQLVGLTRTTCVATMLEAGHAENALPQKATATVNCRVWPGDSVEDVQATLEKVAGVDGLEIKAARGRDAGSASPVRDDLFASIERAIHVDHPDVPIIPYQAPYTTDGAIYRSEGIPTYGVMGLFIKQSDAFPHGLNERVPVDEFYNELSFWHALLTDLARPQAN